MIDRDRVEMVLVSLALLWAGCCCASSIGGAQDSAVLTFTGRQAAFASSPGGVQNGDASGAVAVLARVCWKEASFSLSDCAAIGYVLQARARRARWPFERMAWAYASLDADHPRARRARELPDSDAPDFSSYENRRWARVRQVAQATLAGELPNPCPRALHWGGLALAADLRRATTAQLLGKWRLVRCKPSTANAFYEVL